MVKVKYNNPGDVVFQLLGKKYGEGFSQDHPLKVLTQRPNMCHSTFYPTVATSPVIFPSNDNYLHQALLPGATAYKIETVPTMGASATSACYARKHDASKVTTLNNVLLHALPKERSNQRNKSGSFGKPSNFMFSSNSENGHLKSKCNKSKYLTYQSDSESGLEIHPFKKYQVKNGQMYDFEANSTSGPEIIRLYVNFSHDGKGNNNKVLLNKSNTETKERCNMVNERAAFLNQSTERLSQNGFVEPEPHCMETDSSPEFQHCSRFSNLLESEDCLKNVSIPDKYQRNFIYSERPQCNRLPEANPMMPKEKISTSNEVRNLNLTAKPISVLENMNGHDKELTNENIKPISGNSNLFAKKYLYPMHSHLQTESKSMQDVRLTCDINSPSALKYVFDKGITSEENGNILPSVSVTRSETDNGRDAFKSRKWKNLRDKKKSSSYPSLYRNISHEMFSFITKENVFQVELEKDSRGLGIGICGGWNTDPENLNACLIRIKCLYPLQPALNCGKLNIGDIILSVNGCQLTGLSYTEAIEILRMVSAKVLLIVCRPEEGILPPVPENPKIIAIRALSDLNLNNTLPQICANPQYTEFDVTINKIGGSLGFTIEKCDDPNPGHYIKALVKEPALSNDLKPGDKIILVNGVEVSDMSQAEIIGFLRGLPDEVTLCLWRDVAHPTSPLTPPSPTLQTAFFESSSKPRKTKPLLRKEALDMLSDKARLKNEKRCCDDLHGSSPTPSSQKARFRSRDSKHPAAAPSQNINVPKETWHASRTRFSQESSSSLHENSCTDLFSSSRSSSGIASSLLSNAQNTESSSETDSSGLGVDDYSESNAGQMSCPSSVTDWIGNPAEEIIVQQNSDLSAKPQRPSFLDLTNDSISPRKQLFGQTLLPHQYCNQGGTSDNSDSSIHYLDSSSNSLPFSDDGLTTSPESSPLGSASRSALLKWRGATLNTDENLSPSPQDDLHPQKTSMITVELERRWNSRLGFSLVAPDTSDGSGIYIKLVYPGSLAAIDGRLQVGDRLVEVNGIEVDGLIVTDVIDLLRKSKGKIILKVERLPDNLLPQAVSSPNDIRLSRSQSQHEDLLSNEISNMNVKNNNLTEHFRLDKSLQQIDNSNENQTSCSTSKIDM